MKEQLSGALRAAKAIKELVEHEEELELPGYALESFREIIESETGIVSLLHAAKSVSHFFVYLESIKGEGARDSLNHLRQVIVQIEGMQ